MGRIRGPHRRPGHALAHRGSLEEARKVLESALKLEPGMLEALLLLGGIEVKLGHLDEAEERFSMLLEWDHEDSYSGSRADWNRVVNPLLEMTSINRNSF